MRVTLFGITTFSTAVLPYSPVNFFSVPLSIIKSLYDAPVYFIFFMDSHLNACSIPLGMVISVRLSQ